MARGVSGSVEWLQEWERFVRLFAARELRTSVLVTFLKVEPFRTNRLRVAKNDAICEIGRVRPGPTMGCYGTAGPVPAVGLWGPNLSAPACSRPGGALAKVRRGESRQSEGQVAAGGSGFRARSGLQASPACDSLLGWGPGPDPGRTRARAQGSGGRHAGHKMRRARAAFAPRPLRTGDSNLHTRLKGKQKDTAGACVISDSLRSDDSEPCKRGRGAYMDKFHGLLDRFEQLSFVILQCRLKLSRV